MEKRPEPCVNKSKPLKGEKVYSFVLLLLLLTVTFFPLMTGKNFIPFERYPQWSSMLAQSSGQSFLWDYRWRKRVNFMPWTEDPEFGSIGLNWAENLYFAHNLRFGKLPLWDPYTGGGVPTLDSGQSRPFNPFRLLFYLFPSSLIYSVTLLIGLFFGGIGAYIWLSKRGISPAAVTLGTGLFLLNPWVLDRLVLADSAVYFVFPWCLLTLEQAAWRNWASIGRATLCFVLMGHCGHVVVCIILAGVAFIVYLFSEKRQGDSQESFSRRVKIIGVVSGITLLCLAVLWVPLLKLFVIGDLYKKYGGSIPLQSWKSLITLPSNMFVPPAVGVVLTCALFEWKRMPKVWVVLLGTVFVLFFPMPGIGTRVSEFLCRMGLNSYYLKWVIWLPLSFVAAYGLEAYLTLKKCRLLIGFTAGAAMLVTSGWLLLSTPMPRNEISAFPGIGFLLLTLGLLGLMIFRSVRGTLSSLVISGIILTPLAFPLSLNRLAWNTVDFKTNPVVEWLKANRPNARVASVDPELFFAIPPNLGQAYSLRCVEVVSTIFLNNYRSMFQSPRTFLTAVFFDFLSPEVLKHMGASVVLLPNKTTPSGLELLIRGSHFSAYAIPGAHGRLYFAERVSLYKPGVNFPSQILSMGRDTDAVAVIEGMGNPVPEVIPEIPSGSGNAVFELDTPEEVLVRTECSLEALLVLRDSWYPGWIALIDGKRVPVFRVNGCFRGVLVPPGTHMVRFIYRPILVYIAGVVSLLSTLLVIGVSLRRNLSRMPKPKV